MNLYVHEPPPSQVSDLLTCIDVSVVHSLHGGCLQLNDDGHLESIKSTAAQGKEVTRQCECAENFILVCLLAREYGNGGVMRAYTELNLRTHPRIEAIEGGHRAQAGSAKRHKARAS